MTAARSWIDLALTQVLGGEAISDFQGLRHLAPAIGPVASTPTVWRTLSEAGLAYIEQRYGAEVVTEALRAAVVG